MVEVAQDGVDNREAIDKLSMALLAVMEEHNPSMEVLFCSLAANVVGHSMQYVHAANGEITHEEVHRQLTRFFAYAVDLAQLKISGVNEVLNQPSE